MSALLHRTITAAQLCGPGGVRAVVGETLTTNSTGRAGLANLPTSHYHRRMTIDIRAFARAGARARLAELQEEASAIYREFPDLRPAGHARPSRGGSAASNQTEVPAEAPGRATRRRRKRKPMTTAQRKAVGERMKKYWAARKRAEAKK